MLQKRIIQIQNDSAQTQIQVTETNEKLVTTANQLANVSAHVFLLNIFSTAFTICVRISRKIDCNGKL